MKPLTNYEIIDIRKILFLYELTCHKVCLLYVFIFLIILHIRCKIGARCRN